MESTNAYGVSDDKAVEVSRERKKRGSESRPWSWEHGENPKFLPNGRAGISDVGMQNSIFMHNDVRYKKFIIMTMKLYIANKLVTLQEQGEP